MVSTQGGDIDRVIASERFGLLQVFLVAAAVMLVLSILLAGAIAGPVRRLADAAERVRRGIKSRQEIPDFTIGCRQFRGNDVDAVIHMLNSGTGGKRLKSKTASNG